MKEKYVEHDFPRYFEFGVHADGRVDIATPSDDTIATVSREHAAKLIQQRDEVVQKLCDLARAFDRADSTAFDQFWYGTPTTLAQRSTQMNLRTWTTEEIIRYAGVAASTALEQTLLERLEETLATLEEKIIELDEERLQHNQCADSLRDVTKTLLNQHV